MSTSKIELLSCHTLLENKQILSDIELIQKGLFKEIGWHYYVDIIWVVNNLKASGINPGAIILDAGAGNGLLQYLLALYGYNVISVDFSPRKISLFILPTFFIEKMISSEKFESSYIVHVKESWKLKNKFRKLLLLIRNGNLVVSAYFRLFRKVRTATNKPGKIVFLQSDMQNMKRIDDHTIDAVVSVSAIEHMEIESIKNSIVEFKRVLKKGSPIILTTSAAKSSDWYHQPSKGWCFSKKTITSLLRMDHMEFANFNNYDEILSEYKTNIFLKNNLAERYLRSNDNGMPLGLWDPQYLPVGIVTYNKSQD